MRSGNELTKIFERNSSNPDCRAGILTYELGLGYIAYVDQNYEITFLTAVKKNCVWTHG